jgi:hypothetical protein
MNSNSDAQGVIGKSHWIVGLALTVSIVLSCAALAQASKVHHCGSTPPYGATKARGVSCRKAHRVVRAWGKAAPRCGPGGQACRVQGWTCVVPVNRHNSTTLYCRKGRKLILAALGAY